MFCRLIRVAIARRIGGQWPSGLQPQFGDNALGDGQLFFDFRNDDVVKFWAEHVVMDAVNDYVDGVFTDDPGGYGQEHPSIQVSRNSH